MVTTCPTAGGHGPPVGPPTEVCNIFVDTKTRIQLDKAWKLENDLEMLDQGPVCDLNWWRTASGLLWPWLKPKFYLRALNWWRQQRRSCWYCASGDRALCQSRHIMSLNRWMQTATWLGPRRHVHGRASGFHNMSSQTSGSCVPSWGPQGCVVGLRWYFLPGSGYFWEEICPKGAWLKPLPSARRNINHRALFLVLIRSTWESNRASSLSTHDQNFHFHSTSFSKLNRFELYLTWGSQQD